MIDKWPLMDRLRVWASRGFPLDEMRCAFVGHMGDTFVNARGFHEWRCARCDYGVTFDLPEDA